MGQAQPLPSARVGLPRVLHQQLRAVLGVCSRAELRICVCPVCDSCCWIRLGCATLLSLTGGTASAVPHHADGHHRALGEEGGRQDQ